MARPPKFDYDSDKFYDEIFALAFQGFTDAEIADGLEDKFGESISPERFSLMKNGKYEAWSEEENKRRGERLCKVLARARRKINTIVRGRFLKLALGGAKIKSNVKRHMIINGERTEDEDISTTESELPPNLQALSTWLYHHDPDWRRVERKQDDDATEEVSDGSIPINKWIEDNTER